VGRLFHLTQASAWEGARTTGRYEVSTRGISLAEQGFIHCSLPHQVAAVAEALFADLDDLVLLVIDDERLDVAVRYESATAGGERFPHIYGPVPITAVTDVIELTRRPDGTLNLPD
jgi:uncharacterized protein (DUF952 family)